MDAGKGGRSRGHPSDGVCTGAESASSDQADNGLPFGAPPPGVEKSDVDVEAAVLKVIPNFDATPSRQLVDAARRSAGLPPVLAAAHVAAERAPADALLLVRTGMVQWLRDMLNRGDARSSLMATLRLCYTLRAIMEHTPTSATPLLQEALLTGEAQSAASTNRTSSDASIAVLLCRAMKMYSKSSAILEVVAACLGQFSLRGSASRAAVLRAGGGEAILEAMEGSQDDSDVQMAGCNAMLCVMESDDDAERRQHVERVVNTNGIRRFVVVLERHPSHDACTTAALQALVLVAEEVAPAFVDLLPYVEADLKPATASPLQARVSRHMLKGSVPLICAALLLDTSTAEKITNRDSYILRLLASCARLGKWIGQSQLLLATSKARKSLESLAELDCVRQQRMGASAACELWALFHSDFASSHSLHELLVASTAMRDAARAYSVTGKDVDEFGRRSLTTAEEGEHAAWCEALIVSLHGVDCDAHLAPIDALMHASLVGGFTSGPCLGPTLRAVFACLRMLPAERSQSTLEGLYASHGLLATIRRALNQPEHCAHRPSAIAAACSALAYLVRTGGQARKHALNVPVLKQQGALDSLLCDATLVRSERAQAAGCDLVDAVLSAGHLWGGKSACGIRGVLHTLMEQGIAQELVARAACDALSTCCSTVGPSVVFQVFNKYHEDDSHADHDAELIRHLSDVLQAHSLEPETTTSIVLALRLLCVENTGTLRAAVAPELQRGDTIALLQRAVSYGGNRMRGVGGDKLLAALV